MNQVLNDHAPASEYVRSDLDEPTGTLLHRCLTCDGEFDSFMAFLAHASVSAGDGKCSPARHRPERGICATVATSRRR